MVAVDVGVCLWKDLSVSPGKGGRKPLRSAVAMVEFAGDHKAAWAKVTRSCGFVVELIAFIACCCMGMSTIHKPLVVGCRFPVRMVLPQ